MKIHREMLPSASWRCPLISAAWLGSLQHRTLGKILQGIGRCPNQWKAGQAGGFLELGIQWNVAMHISNVRWRFFQYKAAICTRTANSTPFQWGQKNAKFQMEENSHMTLAHSSRPFFHLYPALGYSRAVSGGRLESGAGLIWRDWLSSPSSALCWAKVLDVYIFSHI